MTDPGLKSKFVELQMEQASESPVVKVAALPPYVESLRLSRARTLEQLKSATNPKHRKMLRKGLKAIESEMIELVGRKL